MLVDKTGRKIKPGMYVDVRVDPLVIGQVMEVRDSSIEIPGQGRTTPHIVIALLPVNAAIDRMVDPTTAMISGVYIVAEAPSDFEKNMKKESERESGESGSNVKAFETGFSKDGKSH